MTALAGALATLACGTPHTTSGTEHLLLGLLVEGEGIAAHVLQDMGVTEADARAEIEVQLKAGGPVGLVKLGDEVREALDRARQLAREAGADTVQVEHLRKALRRKAG